MSKGPSKGDKADRVLGRLAERELSKRDPKGAEKLVRPTSSDSDAARRNKAAAAVANRAMKSSIGTGVEDLPTFARARDESGNKTGSRVLQANEDIAKTAALLITYLTAGRLRASWLWPILKKVIPAIAIASVILLFVLFLSALTGGSPPVGSPNDPAEPQSSDVIGYDSAGNPVLMVEILPAILQPDPSPAALSQIPENIIEAYKEAAIGSKVPWTVLAAIAAAATDHGRFSPYDDCDRRPDDSGFGSSLFTQVRTGSYGPEPDQDDGPSCTGKVSGRYLMSSPKIGDISDDIAVGPYLIYSSVAEGRFGSSSDAPHRLKGAGANNASAYMVELLMEIYYVMTQEEDWEEPIWTISSDATAAELEYSSEFWREAVARLPIADSANLGCEPSARDTSTKEAIMAAIREIWTCELYSARSLRTIIYETHDYDIMVLDGLKDRALQVRVLVEEAVQAAGLYSDLGAKREVMSQALCGRVPLPGLGIHDGSMPVLSDAVIIGDRHAYGMTEPDQVQVVIHAREVNSNGSPIDWTEESSDQLESPRDDRPLTVYRLSLSAAQVPSVMDAAHMWVAEKDRLVVIAGTADAEAPQPMSPDAFRLAVSAVSNKAAELSKARGSALEVQWVSMYDAPHPDYEGPAAVMAAYNKILKEEASSSPFLSVIDWRAFASDQAARGRGSDSPYEKGPSAPVFTGSYYRYMVQIAAAGPSLSDAIRVDPLIQGIDFPDGTETERYIGPAGVFPLDERTFDEHNLIDGASRCDPIPSIAAAAAAFAKGESVTANRTAPPDGSYESMLGGWAAMPAVLGSQEHLDEFVSHGKSLSYSIDELTAGARSDRAVCRTDVIGPWVDRTLTIAAFNATDEWIAEAEDTNPVIGTKYTPTQWPQVLASGTNMSELELAIEEIDRNDPNAVTEALSGSEAMASLLAGARGQLLPPVITEACERAAATPGSEEFAALTKEYITSRLLFPGTVPQTPLAMSSWLIDHLMSTPYAQDLESQDAEHGRTRALMWAQSYVTFYAVSKVPGAMIDPQKDPPQMVEQPNGPQGPPPLIERLSSRHGVVEHYQIPKEHDETSLPKLVIRIAEMFGGLSAVDTRGSEDETLTLVGILTGAPGLPELLGVPEVLMEAATDAASRATLSTDSKIDAAFILALSDVALSGPSQWADMGADGHLEPLLPSGREGPFALSRVEWLKYGSGSDDGLLKASPAALASALMHLGLLDSADGFGPGPWDLSSDRTHQIAAGYLAWAGVDASKPVFDSCHDTLTSRLMDKSSSAIAAILDDPEFTHPCRAVAHGYAIWRTAEDYRAKMERALLLSAFSSTASDVTHELTGFLSPVPLYGPDGTPLNAVYLGGGFGAPRDGGARLHQGVDYMDADDKSGPLLPIFSVADGQIKAIYEFEWGTKQTRSGKGWRIRHADVAGYDYVDTLYFHLEDYEPGLAVGHWVKAGQRIGWMGNTGDPAYKTPLHLHFEVRLVTDPSNPRGGTPVDPIPWVPKVR